MLTDLVRSQDRKFNIIISSILYDGINNAKIYAINNRLNQLAITNECIKFLDLNSCNKSTQSFLQNTIVNTITLNCPNFKGSSLLRFINCTQNYETQSSKNFTNSSHTQDLT